MELFLAQIVPLPQQQQVIYCWSCAMSSLLPEVWLSCKSLSQTKAGAQVQGYLGLSSWSSKSHLDPRREFQAAHTSTRQWLPCREKQGVE